MEKEYTIGEDIEKKLKRSARPLNFWQIISLVLMLVFIVVLVLLYVRVISNAEASCQICQEFTDYECTLNGDVFTPDKPKMDPVSPVYQFNVSPD